MSPLLVYQESGHAIKFDPTYAYETSETYLVLYDDFYQYNSCVNTFFVHTFLCYTLVEILTVAMIFVTNI